MSDYERLKSGLEEVEIQLNSILKEREDSVAPERILSSQINELRSRNTTLETGYLLLLSDYYYRSVNKTYKKEKKFNYIRSNNCLIY